MRKPGRLDRMQKKAMAQKKVMEARVATEEKWRIRDMTALNSCEM